MAALFFTSAFVATFLCARRSLGHGCAALLMFGYFSGVIRANYLGVFTTLMFDAAVAGLYLASLDTLLSNRGNIPSQLRSFVLALVGWPALLMLVPMHDPLIQLVGLRAEAWLVPLLLIGASLKLSDLRTLAHAAAALNLVALGVGVYLYFRGVEALYPMNVVTEIIYKSRDVAGSNFRIPATFLSAHAYGGTMVMTVPLLAGGLTDRQRSQSQKLLLLAGIVAALAGVMMCGARLPAAMLVVATFVCWYRSGMSIRLMSWVAIVLLGAVTVAGTNPRLQRFFDLSDPEKIVGRAHGSMNEGVVSIMLDYPLGAGLGAGAPSIPYFLAGRAPPPVPVENEYARLVVDMGWIGLALWLAFLAWLYHRKLHRSSEPAMYWTALFGHGVTLTAWSTGLIGTGILTSIPGTALLMLQMGIVARASVVPRRVA